MNNSTSNAVEVKKAAQQAAKLAAAEVKAVQAKAAEARQAAKEAAQALAVNPTADSLALVTAAYKAETKAQGTFVKAFDALYADGVRSEHLLKTSDLYCADAFNGVQAAIVSGVCCAADAKLLAMSADEAKGKGVSSARTALTRVISKYMGNVRRSLDARDPVKQEEKAKAAKAEKAAKGATGEHGEQATSDAAPATAEKLKGIDPSVSAENYMAALNVLIVATRNHDDYTIKSNADSFCEVLAEMIRAINVCDTVAKRGGKKAA